MPACRLRFLGKANTAANREIDVTLYYMDNQFDQTMSNVIINLDAARSKSLGSCYVQWRSIINFLSSPGFAKKPIILHSAVSQAYLINIRIVVDGKEDSAVGDITIFCPLPSTRGIHPFIITMWEWEKYICPWFRDNKCQVALFWKVLSERQWFRTNPDLDCSTFLNEEMGVIAIWWFYILGCSVLPKS